MARGKHLFPFRTEQLSPSAPMVLGPQGPGRVGRRRLFLGTGRLRAARSALWSRLDAGRLAPVADGTPAAAPASPRRTSTRSSSWTALRRSARRSTRSASTSPTDPAALRAYERRLRRPIRASSRAVERASGRLLGWFQVEEADGAPGELELGYRLRPDAWGQGYATEGAAALLRRRARPAGRRARVRPRAALQPGLDPRDGEDRHDLRRPVGLQGAAGRRVRGA